MSDSVEIVPQVIEVCSSCGREFGIDGLRRSPSDSDRCIECARTARKELAEAKRDNKGWLQAALDQGIPLWEQQPDETSEEYRLWGIYKSLWPSVRPTVTKVADKCGVTVQTVQRAFTRWTWGARLQAWIREVNADRTAELRQAQRKMVEDHIKLGEAMREKMAIAVENLDPFDVTPNELVSLLKETQRLEQSGREALSALENANASDIDGMPAGLFADSGGGNSDEALLGNRRGLTEDEMVEVVEILSTAGVFKGKAGIKKTTTIEAVVDSEL